MAIRKRKFGKQTQELLVKKIIIVLACFIFLSACSTATEVKTNSETVNKTAANSNVVMVSNANSQMIPMNGVDANAFNKDSSNMRVVNRDTSNMKPTLGARPAPDESEFAATGKPDGSFAETRTFKNHPQLLKIEKTTNGNKTSLKVYLKNGKVFDVTEEQIPNFSVAASQNILLAVGIKPNLPNTAEKSKKDEINEEKEETGKP
jgi:uncharacterized protein YceK